MLQLRCNENWNGNLLADCFPILRPLNEGWLVDQSFSILYKGKFAGTATVRSGKNILWKDINDHIAHLVIAKPAFELKSVLRSFYGFGGIDPHPEFPVFYGIAEWTERDHGTTAIMFNEEWKKVGKKAIPVERDEFSQEPLFTIDHD